MVEPQGRARGGHGHDVAPTLTDSDSAKTALDRIVIELDTAVVQKVTEGRPAGKGVPDRVREATAARNATKLRLEPTLHRLDQGP